VDVALVASGTATLEAALFKRPMVISYNTHWALRADEAAAAAAPGWGLPNILCQDFVVPEFAAVQRKTELLSGALAGWLDSPARMAAVQEKFRALHLQLKRDTAKLATDAIEETIHRTH
jgi:lipid-A-disaccharide synthase